MSQTIVDYSVPSMWRDALDGVRDALPVLMAIVPFAAVFGALAREAGFSFGDVMIASATIYAGASQYVMLELWGTQAPAWSIVLSVFVVNFRHILYSAAIGRRFTRLSPLKKTLAFFLLTDPQFATAERRMVTHGSIAPAYYFGYGLSLYTVWMISNALGALFGALIEDPAAFGFDFILPLYFVGLALGFRTRPNFVVIMLASGCASLLAYVSVGSPWHITVGGLAGLVLAAALSKPDDAVPLVEPSETAEPGRGGLNV
ncbi:MAG: AzlC family ABC transporter permease [Pseudomonadota bacterium]